MCRRPLIVAAVLAALAAPVDGSAGMQASSWAAPEIRLVVSRGLMAPTVASFRPDDALTRGELEELVAGLTGVPPATPATAAAPVTIAELDSRLVRALGLQDAAASFARSARAAGLAPPGRFGSEVVARLLGLRTNHVAARDILERLPNDPAPRAEAAFSAARVLRLGGWEADAVRALAATFALPTLDAWQRRVLRRAISLVGYPYVWGGESETTTGPYGAQAQGGFDCSGFVWRVYKIEQYTAAAATLSETLRGRTSMAMSAEIPRAARIDFASLRPGDVVFFGAAGPRSKPAQIDHMGIYVATGWFVHSSRYGVALAPFDGWYRTRFAWARRPLAEAGLSTG